MSILQEAQTLVYGERAQAYGPPSSNFQRWAELCHASGRINLQNLTGEDLAFVMILLKLSRNSHLHKRDNLVDAAGYLDIFDRLTEEAKAPVVHPFPAATPVEPALKLPKKALRKPIKRKKR